MLIPMNDALMVSAALFAIGVVGIFLNRSNLIVMLMSLELMLLSVNTNFIIFSNHFGHLTGQIFAFFILAVAAAESAIGLAILVALYRRVGSINVDDAHALQG